MVLPIKILTIHFSVLHGKILIFATSSDVTTLAMTMTEVGNEDNSHLVY